MKILIGPAIAIVTIIVGECFLRGKSLPLLFGQLSEQDNIALSNIAWVSIAFGIVIVFIVVLGKVWLLKEEKE